MDCIATLSRSSLHPVALALALSISVLSLQSGVVAQASSDGAEAPVQATVSKKAVPAPAYRSFGPFSKIAVGVSVGTLGTGIEVATPLSRRTNLRVDGYFFNYSRDLTQDGISYNANLHLRDVRASYDFFPFHGGFRLSGGVAVYNQLNVAAGTTVPPSNTIKLNDVDYYSSKTDPLHGNATISFAHKVAPTLSFGWGNAIPRSGRHFAFPVELGVAFAGTPDFKLNMAGSACSARNDPSTCEVVTVDSSFESNLNAERKKINDDIKPLRFYPILNLGVTYRF
jgi:hypothetical protein